MLEKVFSYLNYNFIGLISNRKKNVGLIGNLSKKVASLSREEREREKPKKKAKFPVFKTAVQFRGHPQNQQEDKIDPTQP